MVLFLVYDDVPQHNYFEVIDDEDYVIGRGKTEEEAIASARKTTDEPINTYWGVIDG